ncbi:MAG: PCP reductase family protein [Candidatus Manganitrophus sp.]|nr:MAG: PCP reductase family protein [Candidatus Manganitrophus sp.]
MKFVCMKCESFMTFENVQVPGEQSLGVTFACPTCNAKVAMVTNPGETAMVQALGVKLGGRTAPAEPMELTRQTLKETPDSFSKPAPSPAVQKEMLAAEMAKASSSGGGTCPFSSMIAQMQGGTKQDAATGELTWTAEAKERIEKVPSFMRPMIQMGIESYARRNGLSTITPDVMDASKNDQGEMVWSKEAESRLDNIPSFIRPMAKKEIERMAKERGQTQITADLMEEAKSKFIGMGY